MSIRVGFITSDMTPHEPRWLALPAVPRVGDHVTLDTGKPYIVRRVHWIQTLKEGFDGVEIHLEPFSVAVE